MSSKRKMFIDTLVAHRNYLVRTTKSKNAFTVETIISDFDEYDLWDYVKRIDVDSVSRNIIIVWVGE